MLMWPYRYLIKPISRTFVRKPHRPAVRYGWCRVQSLLYAGNRVTCPCCDGHFRKFVPFGVIRKPNAQCPRCESKKRHRLLWLFLKNKTNLFTDTLSVLHFAPEYRFYRIFSSLPNLQYTPVDLDALLARIKLDITALPFMDASFDVIICNHVLEHVPDDRQAMRELYRVLKPGGWAVVSVPVDPDRTETFEDPSVVDPIERERLFGQWDHLRVYGTDYPDRLEQAGFTVRAEHYGKELSAALRKRYVVSKHRPIYLCTKPAPPTAHFTERTGAPIMPVR